MFFNLVQFIKHIRNIRIHTFLYSQIFLFLSLFLFLFLFIPEYLKASDSNDNNKFLLSNECVEIMSEDYDVRELKEDDPVIFGRAHVIKKEGKYGIISKEGTIIVEPKYDSIILDDNVGIRYIVKKSDKYGLIDFHGRVLIDTEYDFLTATEYDSFYMVRKGDKFGTVDFRNKVFIPLIYDEMEVFKHEIYKVNLGSKVGVVDAFGRIIVPIEYDDVDVYSEFNFIVKKENKYGLFVEDNLVLEVKFDNIKSISRGCFCFTKDGTTGLVCNGKILLDKEFDIISKVYRNLFLVYKNHKFGLVKYVDDELVFVLDMEYDFIELKNHSWNDIGYSILKGDYHFMELQTDDGQIIFDRSFYERDIVVFRKDDKFGLIKINYNQKEDEWKLDCIYDCIEILDRYIFSTSIYSTPVNVDIPMSKYFIMEKDSNSYLMNEQGILIKEISNNDKIFHWGSLSDKAKKICRSHLSEKDCSAIEENKQNSFVIVSEDKTIKIFIDEK